MADATITHNALYFQERHNSKPDKSGLAGDIFLLNMTIND